MEENIVLKTGYLDKFKGQEDYFNGNFFLGKELFLNKDQYNQYSRLEIEGIKFEDLVEKLGKKRTDERYAKLRIRKCVDLALNEYLQLINIELGYYALPVEYRMMPVYMNSINGALEEVGNLAFPEIVELALFNPEGIELVNSELTGLEKSLIYKDIVTLGSTNPLMKYFWDIRINSLTILMDQDYSLKERLLLLAIFYEHLDMLNTEDKVDFVPEKMETLLKAFDTKTYKLFFKSLPVNDYIYLDILEFIMDIDLSIYSRSYSKTGIELSLNGFKPRLDLIDLKSIYYENKDIYDRWYKENLYLIQNYIVNEFLKEAIPYSKNKSLRDLYNNLITDYIVLKTLLIGSSVYSGRLDKNLFIEKISNYMAFKQENPEFLQAIEGFMKLKGYYSTEYLAIIL